MLGKTPVYAASKRQSAIATSTFGAEFAALRTATEDIIDVRYALRAFGVAVTKPTLIFGDNQAVILNATIESSLLNKKHVAIAYHMIRESVAAGIIHPIKIPGQNNFADILTKALPSTTHGNLATGILTHC